MHARATSKYLVALQLETKMAFSSSPRKRTSSQVEFEDLSLITHPESKAVVHGVVTSFSPMKEKSKCFDGYMSDSRKKLRFVGFQQTN